MVRFQLAPGELDLFLAHNEAVEHEAKPDEEWDYARDPDDAENRNHIWRNFARSDYSLEQDIEKNHHASADAAGDDSVLDFFITLELGRFAACLLEFSLLALL